MLVDLHIHESKYSLDSHVSLEKIIEEAKRKGLDGICRLVPTGQRKNQHNILPKFSFKHYHNHQIHMIYEL